jgi:hypothetical protein
MQHTPLKSPSIYAILLAGSLVFTQSYSAPENVSGLVITTQSKIDICCETLSSKLDDLDGLIETNFAGTFTVLAAIVQAADFSGSFTALNALISQIVTTQSKLDGCCQTLNSNIDSVFESFAGTFTVLETITEQNNTIQSKLDMCCEKLLCNPMPIFISGLGTTLSLAGVYCLANDVTLNSSSNTIAINASNIVFDLNHHTITGINASPATAIIVQGAIGNVGIKNGTILNSFVGISVGALAQGIQISDITIVGGDIGFSANAGFNANVNLTNVFCDNVASTGIVYNAPYNCVVESCEVSNGPLSTAYKAIWDGVSGPVGSLHFNKCISTSNLIGFDIQGITDVIFDSCSAQLTSTAFEISTLSTSTAEISTTFKNCICQNCSGRCFQVSNAGWPIGGKHNTTLNNCTINVTGTGVVVTDQLIYGVINDCGVANSNTGYDFSQFSNGCFCVNNCFAIHCQTGFVGTGTTSALFVSNDSIVNQFPYINIGTDSAAIRTITAPINGRGDNLELTV